MTRFGIIIFGVKIPEGIFFGEMDKKFELHTGDVLTTYVKPDNGGVETEPIDGPFEMLCQAVTRTTVILVDRAEPSRRYPLQRERVESGRAGYFVFEKPEGLPVEDIESRMNPDILRKIDDAERRRFGFRD